MAFGIDDAIGGLVSIVNKFIPDTAARDSAKAAITEQMLAMAAKIDEQQASINTVEAASTSLFSSGWRPALGWVCVLVFAEHYLVYPCIKCFYPAWAEPKFDLAEINTVLWALLGIGAYRTVDKGIGVVMKALKG